MTKTKKRRENVRKLFDNILLRAAYGKPPFRILMALARHDSVDRLRADAKLQRQIELGEIGMSVHFTHSDNFLLRNDCRHKLKENPGDFLPLNPILP